MKKRILLTVALAFAALPMTPLAMPLAQDDAPEDVDGLVALLKEQKDNADADVIRKLANLRTRDAMLGLLDVYDDMVSIYMRREICRGLMIYDQVDGAEQPALQKLMDVATQAEERELRESAVDGLAQCGNFGKAFLAMIVDSSADDAIRRRALRLHSGSPRQEDMGWYRDIYKPTGQTKAKKARRGDKKVPYAVQDLRELAFEALSNDLGVEELVEASMDQNAKVRIRALEVLDGRGAKEAIEVAERLYGGKEQYEYENEPNKRLFEPPKTRVAAARIIAREKGVKFADRFIKDATKAQTPEEFSMGIADILAAMNDEGVNKKILKKVGKGKGSEKLFYLRAGKKIEDPKLDKALIKMLKDKEPRAQREAILLLAERRNKDALPNLEKTIAKGKDPIVLSAALQAISDLRRNDAEWEQQLLNYAKHEEPDIRNAAVEQLGRTRNPDYLPMLIESLNHDLWSTRLAAARAIEHMRVEEGVGPICMRMEHEQGRMLHELADILWNLTGKPFRTNSTSWNKWWENEGSSFKIPGKSELKRMERDEEARRLRQISRTTFFGIRVLSHRVAFIIDVSGSMNYFTRGQYVGENGDARIDVAKRELTKSLDALEHESLFNIITFSSDVNAWQERINERTDESLAEAKGFVGRLGAGGATNLYGALRFAFDDPDVDTIFVLSDGEPTAGAVQDAGAIRAAVASWNEHRSAVIHCVAVGGSLQILEWLAQDTGGNYVKYP
ncbi:MAG: HEAT repeat domain-containing protein [Planctomycetota bacterium]|nr:HEAT repeat domain-containing protein [Planctomycetota bacterium]